MQDKDQNPKLTLVGAGPGDPELISLKGIKVLGSADVVLYDALVVTELLKFAPKNSLKISVGKRAGNNKITQDEINEMIVKYALDYGHVVRLKGGDPFIFGRGGEEIEYAEFFGIKTAVVPGISSATGLMAAQKIPITKRGVNESFWVITGTTREGQLSKDIYLAAQSTATVVILMGIKKLQEIVNVYKRFQKDDIPVVIIQNGSLPMEKIVIGSIENIVEKVSNEKISTPAIIIIGEVVNQRITNEKPIRFLSILKNLKHEGATQL